MVCTCLDPDQSTVRSRGSLVTDAPMPSRATLTLLGSMAVAAGVIYFVHHSQSADRKVRLLHGLRMNLGNLFIAANASGSCKGHGTPAEKRRESSFVRGTVGIGKKTQGER